MAAIRAHAALLVVLVATINYSVSAERPCCSPGESCWPSQQEIEWFAWTMNENAERDLVWKASTPPVCGIPSDSNQPLYGDGKGMKAVYVRDMTQPPCSGVNEEFCHMAVRNAPYGEDVAKQLPAIIAWPKTTRDVASSILFGRKHFMCVCIVGSGNDFLNRASCNGTGLMIRTSLLQSGQTMSQWQQKVSSQAGGFYPGPWEQSVGALGYVVSGYGPFNPNYGISAYTMSGYEMVLANGSVLTDPFYSSCLIAGAGAYGVVTSIGYRPEFILDPATSIQLFTEVTLAWEGDLCGSGLSDLHQLVDNFIDFSSLLARQWGGRTYISTTQGSSCPRWKFWCNYVFAYSDQNLIFLKDWPEFQNLGNTPPVEVTKNEYHTWDDRDKNNYKATPYSPSTSMDPIPNKFAGGRPSILVQLGRDYSAFQTLLKGRLAKDTMLAAPLEIHQGMNNIDSYSVVGRRIVPNGMSRAIYHYVDPTADLEQTNKMYEVSPYSNPGDCAYEMPGWERRLYGDAYETYLAMKLNLDPTNFFHCHHCPGADLA